MSGFIDRVIANYLLHTHYVPQAVSAPSHRIWSRVAKAMIDGGNRLVSASDDFLCPKSSNSSTELYSEQAYTSYIDSGGTLVGLADEKGGVLAINHDGTNNDEVWLQSGDATSVLGAISDTAGADHVTAFEARVKISSIADTINWFVGLGEEGLAAADTITDGGALADKDFLGFNVDEADGDAIDFVYRLEGQTLNVHVTGLAVPVADTFIKLGFVYDPTAPESRRITLYVDNTEQSDSTDYVTKTDIEASDFPDGQEMSFLAGLKDGGLGAAAELGIDWWAFAQIIA